MWKHQAFRTAVALPLLALLQLGLGLSAFAQKHLSPLPVDEIVNARSFWLPGIAPSPDGQTIAYVVGDPLRVHSLWKSWLVPNNDIFLLNMANGTSQNLTVGLDDNSSPAWSPDGRFLAFLKGRSESDGNSISTAWIWEKKTNKMHQVETRSGAQTDRFTWMPDGHRMLLLTSAEKTPVSAGGDGSSQPTKEPVRDSSHEDQSGAKPTVRVYEGGTTDSTLKETDKAGPWSLDYFYDLSLIDIESGRVEPLIKRSRVSSFWVSPDGSSVAYPLTKRFEKPGAQQILYDLLILDLTTRRTRLVAEDVQLGPTPFTVSWSPDSRWLSYRTIGDLAKGDLCLFSLQNGSLHNVTQPAHRDFSNLGWAHATQPPLWTSSNHRVYFVAGRDLWEASADDEHLTAVASFPTGYVELVPQGTNELWQTDGGRSTIVMFRDEQTQERGFFRIDLKTHQLSLVFKSNFDFSDPIYGVTVTVDGREAFYTAQTASEDFDMWGFDSNSTTPRRLTQINPQFAKYEMGTSRTIEWRSLDGQVLHGALLLPAGYEEGKRYPLVVGVYGGDLLSKKLNQFGLFGCDTPINGQLLATRGYALLCPDAPQHLGTPMLDLAKTILPAINRVVELGIADPERIGLMGQSYGGYCVLSLLVQSSRFKAAIVSAGLGDIFADYGAMQEDGSSFGISGAEQGQMLMGGTPWEYRTRYFENSPFFYLDRVGAPVLILHGSADDTVPSFLADEVFVSLRRLGKPVVYAKYQGESHSALYWKHANEKDYISRALDWFEKYLKPSSGGEASSQSPANSR